MLEAVARIVARRYRPAGLWTMFRDDDAMRAAIDGDDGPAATMAIHPAYTSRLNGLPRGLRRWLLPLYPSAVGQLSRMLAWEHARRPVDLLVSTSSAAIKGLRPPPGVPHICYCHTPARYLWSQGDQYASGRGGALRSLGLGAFGPGLRRWDRRTAAHVTTFVANSRHTAGEILARYARDSTVICPPVRTHYFTPDPSVERDGSWLYVGALEPYKRVDLVLGAARGEGVRVVVVGDGSQAEHLRKEAPGNVEFLGRVNDARLRDLYRRASALLFPQVEDFGIVAVEAQACGLPVAAFGAGGGLETVLHAKTGYHFQTPTAEGLLGAARACARLAPTCGAACRANAERFSEAVFEQKMAAFIERSRGR